nr:MAG TPA: hypothetical protein [Caudoviricetes sp.]
MLHKVSHADDTFWLVCDIICLWEIMGAKC